LNYFFTTKDTEITKIFIEGLNVIFVPFGLFVVKLIITLYALEN